MSITGFIKFISPEAARKIMRAVKFSVFFLQNCFEKKNNKLENKAEETK